MLICWGAVTSAPASTGFWNWRTCRRRCPMAVKLEPSSLSPSACSFSFLSSFSSSSPCSFDSSFPLPLLLTLSLPFPLPYPCPRPFTRSPLPPRPFVFRFLFLFRLLRPHSRPVPNSNPFPKRVSSISSSSPCFFRSSCSELQSSSEAGFFHFLFFSLLLSLVLFLFRVLFPFLFLSHTFVRVPLLDFLFVLVLLVFHFLVLFRLLRPHSRPVPKSGPFSKRICEEVESRLVVSTTTLASK